MSIKYYSKIIKTSLIINKWKCKRWQYSCFVVNLFSTENLHFSNYVRICCKLSSTFTHKHENKKFSYWEKYRIVLTPLLVFKKWRMIKILQSVIKALTLILFLTIFLVFCPGKDTRPAVNKSVTHFWAATHQLRIHTLKVMFLKSLQGILYLFKFIFLIWSNVVRNAVGEVL